MFGPAFFPGEAKMKLMRVVMAVLLASVLAGCGYNEIQSK